MNTAVPFQAEKPIFRKLESIADVAMLTHDERVHYNISLNSFRTSLAVMEHQMNLGLAKGIEQGIEQGRAEGRAEGIAEGILQSARLMLDSGMSKDAVATILHLTAEQAAML